MTKAQLVEAIQTRLPYLTTARLNAEREAYLEAWLDSLRATTPAERAAAEQRMRDNRIVMSYRTSRRPRRLPARG